MLRVDVEKYGSLQLTAAARPVLRGEATVELRRDALPARRTRRGGEAPTRVQAVLGDGDHLPTRRTRRGGEAPARVQAVLGDGDQALFDALRAQRRALAEQQGVPPYVIFHDASLIEMAARRPGSLAEFTAITGVGATKLERYGETFLEIIRSPHDRGTGPSPRRRRPLVVRHALILGHGHGSTARSR